MTVSRLRDLGNSLHQQLISGDFTAPARIAETFFELVQSRLIENNHARYHDLVVAAVEDAFLNYFNRPEQYNPEKASLGNFLYMSARRDWLNLLKREKRYTEHIDESVELGTEDAEYMIEAATDETAFSITLEEDDVWQKICEIVSDPTDQQLVALLIDNVRETNIYATILGITDKPPDEQRRLVKKHKDRLKKQLQRNLNPREFRNE